MYERFILKYYHSAIKALNIISNFESMCLQLQVICQEFSSVTNEKWLSKNVSKKSRLDLV